MGTNGKGGVDRVGVRVKETLEERKARRERMWREFSETGDQFLRNALILEYMPIVYSIADSFVESLPSQVQLEDVISWGVFGLIGAVDAYDISRGTTFETFCSQRVRGAMVDGLRENDWVPRQTRARMKKLNGAIRKFEGSEGRLPSEEELAAELGLSAAKMRAVLKEVAEASIYSLEESAINSEEDSSMKNAYSVGDPDAVDPLEEVERRELVQLVRSQLSKNECEVILMYYMEGATMGAISRKLCVCESRVSQIHKDALAKLRRILSPALAVV